ncbi:MAG: Rieske 2Fe-2S domain-containing protein [Bacteroidota bacterium]
MFFKKIIIWHKLFDSIDAINAQVAVGKVTTINVGRKKICLARTADGFFAVNDKCPHNGASLGNGYCTAEGSVVCPVHRYHFDLRTGRAKSGLGDFVQTYPIEVRNDGVYIGFEQLVWNWLKK